MTRLARLLSILVLCPAALSAAPQSAAGPQSPNTLTAPASAPPPAATLRDFAWLAGTWTGTGLGGHTDESWSPAAGGAMMGMFRLVRDGKVVFYEFLTLVELDGSVALKLKHFNPDLTGWEEKANFVTFRLVRVERDAVYFSGLTFRRTTPDALEIFLALRDTKADTVREERFQLTRVR